MLPLVPADGEAPWNGVLVPVERSQHGSLLKEFPALVPHPVLGKWLYLAAEADEFETVAPRIVELVGRDDPRFGVVPGASRRRPRSARPARRITRKASG